MTRTFNTALITGITGSGGSYLADHIVEHHPDVAVHGIARWHSVGQASQNLERSGSLVQVHECDLLDMASVVDTIRTVEPDVIFHLAAHANVRASFTTPLSVVNNNVMGTANLLEAIRLSNCDPVLQMCSTSEVYGAVDPDKVPINEDCPYNPVSPYAVSKVTQDFLSHTYFLNHGMKVIRTRMFAYINPRRADLFATSFALQVARIEEGLQEELTHGNLKSTRTLIDVRDAMESYWVAAEKCDPGEAYNIGGTTVIKVGEFLDVLKQQARCEIPSRVDPALLRPTDVTLQIPDTSKFEKATDWRPKFSFEESVGMLLDHVRALAKRERIAADIAQNS